MAHGFLTPQEVSGESPLFGKIAEWLKKQWDKRNKQAGIIETKVSNIENDVALLADKPAARMLGYGKTKGLLTGGGGSLANNPTDIDVKTGRRAPSGGPNMGGKGGAIANLPISPPSGGGLNAEAFFTKGAGFDYDKVYEAVKAGTLTASQAREIKRSATSVAPSITPDSGADIVAAVNKNTEAIARLIGVTKEQTSNDSRIVQQQIQTQETLMSRSAARAEENALEAGSDLSGFLTPENFAKRKKNEEKKETGSKLKEFFRGPNPFKKDQGCGCSPILGGPPGGGGGFGGIGVPDYVDPKKKTMGRPSRLGGGSSVMRRGGGGKAITRGIAKTFGAGAAKGAAKGFGKMGLKKIPGVGAVAGAAFAAERAMKGDWLGAGGELLSGLAGTIPGIGTGVSTAIDAGLMARDAGLTPFARGGIITQPTAGLVGEAGQEGVFPLEGSRGKKTFKMFGEGIFQAQKDNDSEFAKLQSKGLKQYYETEGGFEKMGNILGDIFKGIGGVLSSLVGGAANAAGLGAGGGGGLVDPTISGDEEEYLMRLMIAEAGGEGEVGMAAVGRSVLNRAGLIQSGEVRPGMFNAKSGSIMDVINASGQYQPVSQGKLKRDLTPEERARAKKALEMARNQASLRGNLEAQGMASGDINKIMASTGFRTKDAFYDKSQEVNVTTLGAHRFNTAGNAKMLTPGAEIKSGAQAGTGMATFGETGRVFNEAGYVHGHFQSDTGTKADVVNDVLPIVRGLLNSGVTDVSITSGETFRANMSDAEIKGLIEKGIAKHTHSGTGKSVDIFVPKGTKVPFPLADVKNTGGNGGITGILPGSGKTWVGHLTPDSKSGGKAHSPQEPNMAGTNTPGPQAAAPTGQYNIPGAPELSNVLNAANPNTGTPMMATSAQVAMAGAAPSGGAPTIINNYYGGGGQQGGVNPNGVSAGIGMEQTGTAIFQDLRIRALA